jgi:hypothetical protein
VFRCGRERSLAKPQRFNNQAYESASDAAILWSPVLMDSATSRLETLSNMLPAVHNTFPTVKRTTCSGRVRWLACDAARWRR